MDEERVEHEMHEQVPACPCADQGGIRLQLGGAFWIFVRVSLGASPAAIAVRGALVFWCPYEAPFATSSQSSAGAARALIIMKRLAKGKICSFNESISHRVASTDSGKMCNFNKVHRASQSKQLGD